MDDESDIRFAVNSDAEFTVSRYSISAVTLTRDEFYAMLEWAVEWGWLKTWET